MRRIFLLQIVGALIIFSFAPKTAQAQQASSVYQIVYLPSSFTLTTSSGTTGTWNTALWGVDVRRIGESPWGFHTQFATGSQSNWTGAFVGTATSGTNQIFAADFTYRWNISRATVTGFLGFGYVIASFTNAPPGITTNFGTSGVRIGAEVVVPLVSNWSLNGSMAWLPSTSTPGASTSGQVTDWKASLQYNIATPWMIEGGYRSLSVGTGVVPGTVCSPNPCTVQGGGWFVALGTSR